MLCWLEHIDIGHIPEPLVGRAAELGRRPARHGQEQENAASEEDAREAHEARRGDYVTVELVLEEEVPVTGPTLRPLFSADGNRSYGPPLEEPVGLPTIASAEKVDWWRLWQSPALLEGWERTVLILRHYSKALYDGRRREA